MRELLIKNYGAAFVLLAATVMAGLIAYQTTQVPDWYVAVVAAVCGYLFGKKEAAEAEAVRSRGVGSAVGSWIAKPVAKWIALAICAFLLGTVVPMINNQLGKTYEIGYGVTITVNESMTGWTTAQISNFVQWATGYIQSL